MKAVGIGLAFAAYTVGTWGYVLVKGFNITLREWVSPLHPFTGKLDSKGCVPPGFIFPASSQAGVPCKQKGSPSGASAAQVNREAQGAGRASPGSVQGRL